MCVFLTIFLAALGACIGSFLNVVIYRLPRGLSVSQPRRSFCPSCQSRIEWYDNIPVVSWLALRGRCRCCRRPISLQYPLIETAAVVLTMLVWHAGRRLCGDLPIDACWPMVVGTLGLFYCLLGLSAMDLEEYYVDIRLTWLALLIGLVCHAISPPQVWPAAVYVSPGSSAFAFGCTIVLALLNRLWPMPEEQPITEQVLEGDGQGAPVQAAPSTQEPPASARPGPILFVSLLTVAAIVIVAAETVSCGIGPAWPAYWLVIAAGLAVLFVSILAGSWLPTEADEAIAEAVESERPQAVRLAVRETLMLLATVAGGIGLMWLVGTELGSGFWLSLFAWTPWECGQPVAGLSTALFGWILAGGICWLIRVLFTLALRKEALGFGDIHIIAAVGAVLGPYLAIAGFFLAAPVALLGTAVLIFRKNYRTLPFGPWLSVGFLLALLWGRGLLDYLAAGLAGLRLALGGPGTGG